MTAVAEVKLKNSVSRRAEVIKTVAINDLETSIKIRLNKKKRIRDITLLTSEKNN
jgi:hypothetical protein